MTMVVDQQHRPYGGMSYDGINSYQSPHFTDPFSHPTAAQHPPIYQTALGVNSIPKQDGARPTNISMPYTSIPVSAPSLVAGSSFPTNGYGISELLSLAQDGVSRPYGSEHTYSSSPTAHSYTSAAPYGGMNYTQSLAQQQQQQQSDESRRTSQTGSATTRATEPSYTAELDAGRGMVAMSQTDLTPRNIYGRHSRDSTDSYGFPTAHSSSSSISSASNFPYFGGPGSVAGSVDSSVTDYSSTTSESYDSMPSRTLPRPNSLIGGHLPPAPQSMMSQFSSKMSSNTQKKHKCKVCDKRFTRPSSLQTHMYSHTGEKPYACDVEGCGRHFSVVSNLRRHKKVHKGEHEPSSPDEDE